MSSAQILQYIAIGFFLFAVVFVILSIVLFFKLDIRSVINDLTGKTVAREVQTMREESRNAEISKRKSRIQHGMTTSTDLSKSRWLERRQKIKAVNPAMALDEEVTSILTQENDETMILSQDNEATTVLSQEQETTLLKKQDNSGPSVELMVLNTICIVHTDEIIA